MKQLEHKIDLCIECGRVIFPEDPKTVVMVGVHRYAFCAGKQDCYNIHIRTSKVKEPLMEEALFHSGIGARIFGGIPC